MSNIIEIKNLSKQYKAGLKKAVDDISFDVKEGELFAFLGVNGAGKSTTINILSTLLTKSSGEVIICGHNIDCDKNKIKKNIGVVFQYGVLDEQLTVYENLMTRGSIYGIDKADLIRKINSITEKLNILDVIKRPYGKLSGGQKRKCDIARALLSDPKLLFLDEPTTGLDPQSRLDLWRIIKEIQNEYNTTIFVSTHYMEEVNTADRVAIIDDGKLLCLDTPKNLKMKYSHDSIKLYVDAENKNEVVNLLKDKNITFKDENDILLIETKKAIELIDLISEIKKLLLSVEILKGDMDSVFLNVVGRKFSNETN